MKVEKFDWVGASKTARDVRIWALDAWPAVDVEAIKRTLVDSDNMDQAILELTARFDATDAQPQTLLVPEAERVDALARIDQGLRQSLELAADNIRRVAEVQVEAAPKEIVLPQGQSVTIREVPVGAAGIYAPGGRAAYPSSVLMCAIPARVAGVERIALATPPGPDGKVNPTVLAAAALCDVDEVYAMGGAQAIFAFAFGTESIPEVHVVAGPGNAWVREAKAAVSHLVAIDSLAGPSELMVVLDGQTNLKWAALDLCAQAEHGDETPLVAVAVEDEILDRLAVEVERSAASRAGVADAQLALVRAPDIDEAIAFANVFAPEHLELIVGDAPSLAKRVTTAGCVFVGPFSATAFGDYVAGSNHVLPTAAAGRYSGPLGPDVFRRKIAAVEVSQDAAALLAPHVDTLARAEGFPVHGESAMIRR